MPKKPNIHAVTNSLVGYLLGIEQNMSMSEFEPFLVFSFMWIKLDFLQ